jgi:glycosyltransferase involved in cell wall biosynthesis
VRVLHLFANHKVTGPAELALETARALVARGVDARFYSSDVRRTKYRDRWLQLLARERRVPEAALTGVALKKHVNPLVTFFDVRRLAQHLTRDGFDLIHCHLPGDHHVVTAALRRAGLTTPVVRTVYDDAPPPVTRRNRAMLHAAARVIALSRATGDGLRATASAYSLDPARVVDLDPPIDTVRFDPARGVAPRREALGLAPGAFCLGIVARMQTHRRYEVLLEAVRRARERVPGLHLVVVGRGTNQDAVAREPVKAMGLADAVTFTGYVDGDAYVGTLAAFDAKVFLVPGSDGTCRAVREVLSMGVPVITSGLGILPELVRDGETGLVLAPEPSADDLTAAIVRVAADDALRARLGQAARQDAVARFSFERFAAQVQAVYDEVLAPARRPE